MWKLPVILSYLIILHLVFADDQQKDVSMIDERIIGGHEVTIAEFPYQASIEYNQVHICGGAIIGRAWILSAAHCFQHISTYQVRVGTSFRNIGGQVLSVFYILRHQDYSNATRDYDIAIVRLLGAISLSSDAQIIGLPDSIDLHYQGAVGKVSGWGATTENGRPTDVLRAVSVPVMLYRICDELYPGLITRRMMCAGNFMGGVAACTVDSGGPMVVDSVLVGIFSWSDGCAQRYLPGVYTNITVVRDWITDVTGI